MKRILLSGIITALVLMSGSLLAQQNTATVEGKFIPATWEKSISDDGPGYLIISGFQGTDGTTFPYQYELRQLTPEGPLVKSGTIANPVFSSSNQLNGERIDITTPGIYWLVVYDSSSPAQRIAKRLTYYRIEAQ